MAVDGRVGLTVDGVVDDDPVAEPAGGAGGGHHAWGHRVHGRAVGGGQVDALVAGPVCALVGRGHDVIAFGDRQAELAGGHSPAAGYVPVRAAAIVAAVSEDHHDHQRQQDDP